MRLLVTGGAGFIGSEFVRATLRGALPGSSGTHVTVLDKLTYSGNVLNLAPIADLQNYRFVQGDICDRDLVDDVVAGHDAIVHFAAETHVDRSIDSAASFVRTNALGTQVLLEAASRHRLGRFVHISTDEVYGSIPEGAWTEASPVAPNAPYAAAKAAGDLLALAWHRTRQLDVVVTRCTNNYGPYQYPEKLIPLFTTNIMDGQQVPVYGDGRNRRQWLHVSDHCRAIQLVLLGGRPGEVYHIGGGTELTNLELAEHILAACGVGWDMVRHVPDRMGHDFRYSLDTTKIRTELGFSPRVEFADGLVETVEWYRSNRDWWEPLKSPNEATGSPSDASS
ncbi:dTDP-glucose 4,6-dehydratase [Streptomyces inhibens]|uniref:dTDP-glucose 4,6-dehydratase n=1 Tax=Streptomyces inhibens TaxID=2293571 RepID=UPI0037A092F6